MLNCFHSRFNTMPADNEKSSMKIRRKLTWRVKENNKKRERKRRAIKSNIFNGLRTQGNYNLSKNCDTNEVLKALCAEAGWFVEEDGTTYHKDNCKLPQLYNYAGTSYSQNPNHVPSSFPNPTPSYQMTPMYFPSMMISINAPMTPPIYPSTSRNTNPIPTWDAISKESMAFSNYPFATSSTPTSPTHQDFHTPMKFHPFTQSPSKVPTTSSFKMFGVQVQPRIEEKDHDEGLSDLELTLRIGK